MNVAKEVCVPSVMFAMFSFNVKNCLLMLLMIKVSSIESRPVPFLGPLVNGLLGVGLGGGGGLLGYPPMYLTGYGQPQNPMYPNQPINQGAYYPWPKLTMTPPASYYTSYRPTTGLVGAAANLFAGFANAANA